MVMEDELPYSALYKLARELHHHHRNARKMMQITLTHMGEMVGVHHGCLLTFDKGNAIRSAYVLSADDWVIDGTELWETLLAVGVVGFVYQSQRTIVIRNLATDPRWPELPSLLREGSAIGIPLMRDDEVFGVILVLHPEVDYFNDKRASILEEIATLTAGALGSALDSEDIPSPQSNIASLLETGIVPMLLTDLSGMILEMNHMAANMLSYDVHDLQRQSITTIHDLNIHTIGEVGLGGMQPHEEMMFRTTALAADGQSVPVLVRLRRLEINGRAIIEWIEQDITPQMELEQLRRDLTAMVYHDLRGPLQAIRGSIQRLAEVLANHENPAVRTLLHIGVQSTRQLRRMIDSLLDVQRLEEGNAILNRSSVEMRVILVDAIQLIQPLAMDAKQRIRYKFEDNLPVIDADNDMVLRVILNLLENAIKYTPDGGTIMLGAELQDDRVQVTVTDSGPGIPEEMRDKIFDKFNRVKYRNAPQGLGLGLAFCRLAVQAHGGEIWVESQEGNGSTFCFTLPIEVSPANHAFEALVTA